MSKLNYQYFGNKKEVAAAFNAWLASGVGHESDLHGWTVNYYATAPREMRYFITFGCFQSAADEHTSAYNFMKLNEPKRKYKRK